MSRREQAETRPSQSASRRSPSAKARAGSGGRAKNPAGRDVPISVRAAVVQIGPHAINYDNWNGGTYTWALRLEVPVPLYATLEPRLACPGPL